MSESKVAAPATVHIRRTFKAPRARVYAAWTQPQLIKKWFGPPGFPCTDAQTDVVVGGSYRFTMLDASGEQLIVGGVFREIREPELLSYTWKWEKSPVPSTDETMVTVEFHDRDGETEVVLTHDGFLSEESFAGHDRGWNGALDNLATIV